MKMKYQIQILLNNVLDRILLGFGHKRSKQQLNFKWASHRILNLLIMYDPFAQ